MKKILYFVSHLGNCAPTNQLYNIIKYLDRQLFIPLVVTLSREPSKSRWKDFERLGVELFSLSLSKIGSICYGTNRLLELVQYINPDIIHSSGFRVDYIASAISRYSIHFSTQRNYPFHDYVMGRKGIMKIIGGIKAWLHYQTFAKIAHVIACSKSIAEINRKYDLSTDYIQDGIDLDAYTANLSQDQRMKMRQSLKISNEAIVFIFVGSLIHRKAPEILIKAFSQILSSDERFLIIAGNGEKMPFYINMCKQNDRIKFIGHVENIADYLSISNCFVSPSRSEGLPNAVLEALCCGLPVILSDISPHKEIIELNQKIGNVFRLNDVDMLSDLLASFKSNSESGVVARSLVSKHFNAQLMSETYQKKYLEAFR